MGNTDTVQICGRDGNGNIIWVHECYNCGKDLPENENSEFLRCSHCNQMHEVIDD